MNAVEIEAAISDLALQPFDAQEFPFVFLAAFGNKDTTLKRLRTGNNNASDVQGDGVNGVLLRNNIHMAVCQAGAVGQTLQALRASPATTKAKAKFILATDGQTLEAEELISGAGVDGLGGETVACAYADFPDHFGFFLPLAGISTIKEIKDNPIDIRATGRLNKLYEELMRHNPNWATADRRADMNHFMARLVFCFFAEDTDIFNGEGLFTHTVDQMSQRDGTNTHAVLGAVFRAMNTKAGERHLTPPGQPDQAKLPNWANGFPYVNGGLFSGSTEVPRFTSIARTYLLAAGRLKWREINPDIFGSMIQAVADDEERGALGMHYTSVPNILKVLNPLFLDDLRAQLELAGDNKAKLLNLRKRMARIRVFDPACGSGNFLVIAYKQMRGIEAVINERRGEVHLGSEIPLTNFRGIELRDFPAEIARLALIIAEFQCDVLHRGQKDALLEFLPLDTQNWIVCHNALRLDWLSVCRPAGTGVKLLADDLFGTPLNQAEIDFENEGGETYICGNPPFAGLTKQTSSQKDDLRQLFSTDQDISSSVDYVFGWYHKAAQYSMHSKASFAFVSTNSICQGQSIPNFWLPTLERGLAIRFAHTSFSWKNLAKNNAGVIVVIVGLDRVKDGTRTIYQADQKIDCSHINPYLTGAKVDIVVERGTPIHHLSPLARGSIPNCGGNLVLSISERDELLRENPSAAKFLHRYVGSQEISKGIVRFSLLIDKENLDEAVENSAIAERVEKVKNHRLLSEKKATREILSTIPSRYELVSSTGANQSIAISRTTSENRSVLACDLLPRGTIANDNAYFSEVDQLLILSVVTSKLHLAWISTVCGRMKNDYRYANKLGWNTFPVPPFTEQNKADLTACAENILLAREAHFPATIADLYDPEGMPDNLRAAHERNDEVLERIYIGRRFKNDTERLEKLFELYTKMTVAAKSAPAKKAIKGVKA
jgi:hypothetical protein